MSRKVRIAAAVTAVLLLAAAVPAIAKSAFLSAFKSAYTIPARSALEQARCLTCHRPKAGSTTSPDTKTLNSYGADLKAKGIASDAPKAFKAVEPLDSDKDGVKNIDEIQKGTLPGDPKSK